MFSEFSLIMLCLALLALMVAPLLTWGLGRTSLTRRHVHLLLGGVAFGFALFAVWEAVREGTVWALLMAALGFAGMAGLEQLKHDLAGRAHQTGLVLLCAVLCVHAGLDGAVLSLGAFDFSALEGHVHGQALMWAIVAHRLPAGLSIWWVLRRHFEISVAFVGLGALLVSTLVGYMLAVPVIELLDFRIMALAQGLAAGVLLHIVLHPLRH